MKKGNVEKEHLKPKLVTVQGVRVEDKSSESKKVSPLLVLICKHPDRAEPIEFTKIKIMRDDKARVVGLWVDSDKEGNIQKGSALHILMEILNVNTPNDIVGKQISTVEQAKDSPYLCIKGY
ncbi:hypothetical protein COU53_02085 [Candidatus Pacearchaeota archaeon CG10_big_fil_rev_8_21_14_0_10_30_48]|nr:MAG: hypothetical protein COU53_02085 [Candidatus Pacearchaeota archaeon CG10_big_fil_rev_8_21_14_0_10_30_48]